MKTFVTISTLTTLLTLTGCGGGGSSSNEPATAVPTASVEIIDELTNDEPAIVETTGDIIVPEGFSFVSDRSISIGVNMEAMKTERAYLSVCTDYTITASSTYDINYENCILRTPLSNGSFSGELNLGGSVDSLVAVVWFYDGSEPRVTEFSDFDQLGSEVIVN